MFSGHAVQELESAESRIYPAGQNVGAAVGFADGLNVGTVGYKVVGNCEGFMVGLIGEGRKLAGNSVDLIVGNFVGLLGRIVGYSDGVYFTMIAETRKIRKIEIKIKNLVE